MRVLIDANVLARAYFYDDKHANRVLALCMQKNLELIVTDEITNEWIHILTNILFTKCSPALVKDGFVPMLRKVLPFQKAWFCLVSRATSVRLGPCGLYSKDRGDDMYMQCAIDHDVPIILSYDDHLGSLSGKHLTCSGQRIEIEGFQWLCRRAGVGEAVVVKSFLDVIDIEIIA